MMRPIDRKPNFDYFIQMLQGKPTPRPVLFEFILGIDKEKYFLQEEYQDDTIVQKMISTVRTFSKAGYDFAPILLRGAEFPRSESGSHALKTKSLNTGSLIADRVTFDAYPWPSVKNVDFSLLKEVAKQLEPGMKLLPFSHDGILENVIGIVGYENLCLMLYDDEELVAEIFARVGQTIEDFFTKCLVYDEVGGIICNDDWGFNTQTMLSPNDLRKFVFPWYKRIVQKAHDAGKVAVLHSCGYYRDIIEDIIEEIKFDGKHSYEDSIVPVETAYQELKNRIAVLGGIDVDYLVRSTPEDVYKRAKSLLKQTKAGGYALGTGNSVPDFIPIDNYLAILQAAWEDDEGE